MIVSALDRQKYLGLQSHDCFEIVNGQMLVSDPCYDCQNNSINRLLTNVKNGIWAMIPHVSDEGSWGDRVSMLEVKHESAPIYPNYQTISENIGVDSGQCGFFDPQFFKNNDIVEGLTKDYEEVICPEDPWYSYCCDRTLAHQHGVIPYGALSSSGFGDGCYELQVAEENGEIVAGRLIFINDKIDEDDEDLYDDDDDYDEMIEDEDDYEDEDEDDYEDDDDYYEEEDDD